MLLLILLLAASPLLAQSKVDSVARKDSLIASDSSTSRPMPGPNALGHCVMLPTDLDPSNRDAWRREQR